MNRSVFFNNTLNHNAHVLKGEKKDKATGNEILIKLKDSNLIFDCAIVSKYKNIIQYTSHLLVR